LNFDDERLDEIPAVGGTAVGFSFKFRFEIPHTVAGMLRMLQCPGPEDDQSDDGCPETDVAGIGWRCNPSCISSDISIRVRGLVAREVEGEYFTRARGDYILHIGLSHHDLGGSPLDGPEEILDSSGSDRFEFRGWDDVRVNAYMTRAEFLLEWTILTFGCATHPRGSSAYNSGVIFTFLINTGLVHDSCRVSARVVHFDFWVCHPP